VRGTWRAIQPGGSPRPLSDAEVIKAADIKKEKIAAARWSSPASGISPACSSWPTRFLSTHPSHERRIADLQGWMAQTMPIYEAAKLRYP
jgi:Zn-dependent protease with chaperone function